MKKIEYFLVLFDLSLEEIVFYKHIFKDISIYEQGTRLYVALKYDNMRNIKKSLEFISRSALSPQIKYELRVVTSSDSSIFHCPDIFQNYWYNMVKPFVFLTA